MTTRGAGPQSRASVACTACRNRRTKCITDPGHRSCNYCRGKSHECNFHTPDERKRPKSKVYLNSLLDNIQTLEQRLREAGQEPPQLQANALHTRPAQQNRTTTASRDKESTQDPGSRKFPSGIRRASRREDLRPSNLRKDPVHGSPASAEGAVESAQQSAEFQRDLPGPGLVKSHNVVRQQVASEPQQGVNRKCTVWTRIYGPDRFIYDKDSGRINHFSPATCYKIYMKNHVARDSWNLGKRSYRILADIPTELDSYLMDLFWNRYNNILCVIDQQAFTRDQANGGSTYYSGFLHLVCLAMGFRFADKGRPGMRQVTLDDTYSVFQREAKYILDRELEDPRGLTILQALLVLSDVECACGRDDLAAMHLGTCCRLAFDFGLNLDCSNLGLSKEEVKFRKDLLRSCVIYDQAWALYLGRTTNMKISDISMACLPSRFSHLSSSERSLHRDESVSSDEDLHGQILDVLLELSELSSKVQELAQPKLAPGLIADENRLVDVAALNTRLKSWYSTLPPRLAWTAENARDAPRVFFLMHQQFHVSQIILHGPYGHYEDAVGIEAQPSHLCGQRANDPSNISPWQLLARSITMNAAIKIVQGFASYRQKFGTCQTSVFSLQQGGTVFLTLMCNIKVCKEEGKRNWMLIYLYMLMEQLQEMSEIYNPAKIMCGVVKHEMEQLGIDFNQLPTPPHSPEYPISESPMTLAWRTDRGESPDPGPATKRRRLSDDRYIPIATSAPPLNPDLNQHLALPDTSLTGQFEAIATPTPTSFDSADGQFPMTFPGENFEWMAPMSDPTLDPNIESSLWTMDFSETSALSGGQNYDQISNDYLLSILADTHDLDGVDPTPNMLPDIMEKG